MQPGYENRPSATNAETAKSNSAQTCKLDSTLANSVELRAAYAVHVVSTCANGVQRGQTFASIPAAERKITRQRQRGLPVSAVLVQLVPVPWSVIGGDFL